MTQRATTGLLLGPLGFGAMSLSSAYGPISEDETQPLLAAVLDAGITHLDTANLYGNGASERAIGRFLRGRDRESVTIASKVGITAGDGFGTRGIRGDRAYIHEQIDLTLSRLGTDYVDLYYQHRIDPDIPIEETVGALAELVEAGKIRAIGLSEATADELRRASAVHPIAAVQSEWSIVSRDIETYVVPAAVELGITVVPYSPLSRALLTDEFDREAASADLRSSFPRFFPENLDANLALASEVTAIARAHGVSTQEVAIAWLFAKGRDAGAAVSVIPGTRSIRHLHSNVRALALDLSSTDVAALDTIASRVQGPRSARASWVSGGREGLI
ncbi:aldo/keto reductase [Salinibacterium hongtaonis]|uniref:aldo/keto reductase n=1 Tax=Homoserinimonas hongtaonis TaxID=2079791 RepID=UPI000D3C76D9|nr:aldo/keto reductase [Salinibacterium hongtaonis]AWB88686.1 aldo/keto reductase [Salinibacterium hongtaonis]